MIYRIARLELNTLFSSPISWLVLLALFVYSMYLALSPMEQGIINTTLNGPSFGSLTAGRLSGPRTGVIPAVNNLLMLLVPLAVMGVISRERASESIKLLLSSPISLKDVVLGKFLALTLLCLLLTSIVGLSVLILGLSIQDFYWPQAFSCLLTVFLLSWVYSTITLYFSTLSKYPIVDVIATAALLGGLTLIDRFLLDVPVIGDICYWLAIPAHTRSGINGWLMSRDIGYFLLIAALFVFLTYQSLAQMRRTPEQKNKGRLRSVGVVMAVGLIGFVIASPKHTLYWDLSSDKKYSLSESTEALMTSLDSPITVSTYANLSFSGHRDVSGRGPKAYRYELERYSQFWPDYTLNYYLYYTKPSPNRMSPSMASLTDAEFKAAMLDRFQVSEDDLIAPSTLAEALDVQRFGDGMSRVFEYNERTMVMPDGFKPRIRSLAEEVDYAALFTILKEGQKSVFVANGNGERGIDPASYRGWQRYLTSHRHRSSLYWAGFEPQAKPLATLTADQAPDLLVIADPTTPYSDEALAKVKAYIDHGGNLIIASEPNNVAIQPILSLLKVRQKAGLLVSSHRILNADEGVIDSQSWLPLPNVSRMRPVPHLQTAAAFDTDWVSDFTVEPLWQSNANQSWLDTAGLNALEKAEFQPEQGDQKGEQTVALALTRSVKEKAQKILVLGDADFLSNQTYHAETASETTGGKVVSWLTDGQYPMEITYAPTTDRTYTVTRSILNLLVWVFWVIVPALIAVMAGYRRYRRRVA